MNPRRPTPSGPKPDPFDLARAPPHRPERFKMWGVKKLDGLEPAPDLHRLIYSL